MSTFLSPLQYIQEVIAVMGRRRRLRPPSTPVGGGPDVVVPHWGGSSFVYRGITTWTGGAIILEDPTKATSLFEQWARLTAAPEIDLSEVTDVGYMFYGCEALVDVPDNYDTAQVENFGGMFTYCSSLTEAPELVTSAGTEFGSMFSQCTALTSTPFYDLSKATSTAWMFAGCPQLKATPAFNTTGALTFSRAMFYDCSALTQVGLFDTSKVTNAVDMFRNCSSLTQLPAFDLGSVTDFSGLNGIVHGCTELTRVPFKNIRVNLDLQECKKLTTAAIHEVFANLATNDTGAGNVWLSGVPAAAGIDTSVATAKGWSVWT